MFSSFRNYLYLGNFCILARIRGRKAFLYTTSGNHTFILGTDSPNGGPLIYNNLPWEVEAALMINSLILML